MIYNKKRFMKKFYIILAAAVVLCILYFVVTNTDNKERPAQNPEDYWFSLDHYKGVIEDGYTEDIKVQANCDLQQDVKATVFVNIGGEIVASEVYKVDAYDDESRYYSIFAGHEYNGKRYSLIVE